MHPRRALGLGLAFNLLMSGNALAQTWVLSDRPIVSIGEVEGAPEYQLNRVAHARRLSDGRILVTMGPDMRFYDAQGKYISKAGGRGRGPGEFQFIQDLFVLGGDTLLALNFRDKVWLTSEGKYIRQEQMTLESLNKDGWFSEGAMLLPNGNLLAMQYPQEKPNDPRMTELHRLTLRYTLFDVPSGKTLPLIVSGGLRQITHPGGRGGGVQAFSPHARHAAGSDRVYVGDNDTTFVRAFALDGRPLNAIQVATRATRVSAADLKYYRDQAIARISDNQQRKAEFERSWDEVPKPGRYPYWGTVMVDKGGNLWISDPQLARPTPLGWNVFRSDGRLLARVTMPERFIPKEIGLDYVLGVARDEFDVEYVKLYRLSARAR